ncbi:MAG: hypothetical protein ACI3Y5_04390 [Prevotella sp.]
MARIWTRKHNEAAEKNHTADPWHILTESHVAETSPEASNLAPKAKPQDKRIYNTESGR